MSAQLTKPKSDGRVAAGKRLVEWIRQNKEDLHKKTQEPAQRELNTSSSTYKSVDAHMVGVGALAMLAIGLLVNFRMSGKKPVKEKTEEKQFDPFR